MNNEENNVEVTGTVEHVEIAASTSATRRYTKKEEMTKGNDAILATLSTDETKALGKSEILAALEPEMRELVERNWNLRISFLEESGLITSKGKKVAKKYWNTSAVQ